MLTDFKSHTEGMSEREGRVETVSEKLSIASYLLHNLKHTQSFMKSWLGWLFQK